jgi:hypothetical protein
MRMQIPAYQSESHLLNDAEYHSIHYHVLMALILVNRICPLLRLVHRVWLLLMQPA